MVRRLVLVAILVIIAGVAGIVRSHSGARGSDIKSLVSHNSSGEARDEIRQTFDLSPGARVEVVGINGAVRIETVDTKTADVYIERIGASAEALARRKVVVDGDANSLRIHGENGDVGFLARLFGSNPREKVTLKLPRQISLLTKGVNGSVIVGDVQGPVEVRGVNGRVQIGATTGTAQFNGINGNIVVGLKQVTSDGVSIAGVNGNIELQLNQDVNAYLDAKGMNGNVFSDAPDVSVEKGRHGRYWAQIGIGGNSISARGINGNIRLTRISVAPVTTADAEMSK